MDVFELFNSQRNYYLKGGTKSYEFRMNSLIKLKSVMKIHEKDLYEALKLDLNKSEQEAYMTEIGLVYEDISYALKHLKKWMKVKKVKAPLAMYPSSCYIYREPYGVTLVMSPWNYPVLLTLQPVVGAIEGGNTCIIRPSSQTPNVAQVIFQIIEEAFNKEYIYCVLGSREVADQLFEQDFDLIFFTGSPHIGKKVLSCAANHLTPCVLELGGKSPCIVTEKANISLAARRIVFGKTINSGQTCVAPDYLVVHESKREELIKAIKAEILLQFPKGMLNDDSYPKIISTSAFERLTYLISKEKVIYGGKNDGKRIELTLVDATFDSVIMEDEIFGPILPILTYNNEDDLISTINSRPTPLACYVYTDSKTQEKKIINAIPFGGGCVNDCLVHLSASSLPFGGLKQSGMGQYHGRRSFETFTHFKPILKHKTWLDISFRYHPFSEKKKSWIKKFIK